MTRPEEKIAEVLNRAFPDIAFGPDSPGVAAVVAAIRAMSPTEQAELIGGSVDRDVIDGAGYEWVLGPMREVAR